MSNLPISRFPIPDINQLPDDLKRRVLAVQEKAGFIPNIFLALAHRRQGELGRGVLVALALPSGELHQALVLEAGRVLVRDPARGASRQIEDV